MNPIGKDADRLADDVYLGLKIRRLSSQDAQSMTEQFPSATNAEIMRRLIADGSRSLLCEMTPEGRLAKLTDPYHSLATLILPWTGAREGIRVCAGCAEKLAPSRRKLLMLIRY